MANRKDLIIAILATFCLTTTIFMILPTRSQSSTEEPEYDHWYDVNDDGKIDILDIVQLTIRYGATGTPINKTALLLELLDRVEILETQVEALRNVSYEMVPIGAILPWAKNIQGVPTLPDNFVECNGQILDDPESPLHDQTIPDLNGEGRFLRGSSASGAEGGSTTHSHTITGVPNRNNGGYHSDWDCAMNGDAVTDASNLPPYYEVVWIMRIK